MRIVHRIQILMVELGLYRPEGENKARYPELVDRHSRARLGVFRFDAGGRWNSEALKKLGALTRSRAREEPDILRQAATIA